MTSFPAQRLGLSHVRLLRDGFKADVVVFDPRRVGAPATRSQPRQLAVGIEYVLVNGRLVIDAGQHTGALPRGPSVAAAPDRGPVVADRRTGSLSSCKPETASQQRACCRAGLVVSRSVGQSV
jgi:N-acyl-D-aspartate/D-glutamate deacylase